MAGGCTPKGSRQGSLLITPCYFQSIIVLTFSVMKAESTGASEVCVWINMPPFVVVIFIKTVNALVFLKEKLNKRNVLTSVSSSQEKF